MAIERTSAPSSRLEHRIDDCVPRINSTAEPSLRDLTKSPPTVAPATVSQAFSSMKLPGECGIRTRQIAVLIENGVHHAALISLYFALVDAGAVVHFVGPRVGVFVGDSGAEIEANKSMENSPGFLFDALVLPDGSQAVQALSGNGHTMEFIKDMFRHCNTILALGAGRELLEMASRRPVMDENASILLKDGAHATEIASVFIS